MTNIMKNSEDVNTIGFSIVAYAGDARSDLVDSLKCAKDGKFEEAHRLVVEAEKSINLAHNIQTKMLTKEASGENLTLSFIMAHGQNTLMTTMLLKDQMDTILDLYERVFVLEKKLEVE